ncbi:MAG: hypothetical protein KDD09_26695, partial [Phaeodactylibacter sp.]|nr:hypothetical protein [Phaeodactylibacter sp.]
EDNLVFYYSGHGVAHPATGRGFWVPADAVDGDFSTYLNNLDVIDFLRNLKARHIFGIVDSCFSATLFAQRSLDAATRRQYSIPSRWLLTAGRLEPVSDGSLGRHSPFAESLLQQLRYQEEPALWGSDLCGKVLRGVVYNTDKQMPRGEPLQDTGHQGGEFVFLRKGQATAAVDLSGSQEAEVTAIKPPTFIPASE